MLVPTILSARLELVSMSPEFIAAVLGGHRRRAESLIGVRLPADWPGDRERTLRMRQEQMLEDPASQPWLLRAVVLRWPAPEFVGQINFHQRPDAGGAVEVGYSILPEHRRRGYATEAVDALFGWASREHGIRRFIASVSPGNDASLGVIRKFGFVQIGAQWDEDDGEELIFETSSWPPHGRAG